MATSVICVEIEPEQFRQNVTEALERATACGDQLSMAICRRFLSTFLCQCNLRRKVQVIVSTSL